MGRGGRSRSERQGAQPGTRVGHGLPEGSRGDAPRHARTLYSAAERTYRARSWLRIVARGGLLGRRRKIKASKERTFRPEKHIRIIRTHVIRAWGAIVDV